MQNLIQGKKYIIKQTRKRYFTVIVNKIAGNLATCTITAGIAHYVSEPNREPGDKIELSVDSTMFTTVLLP